MYLKFIISLYEYGLRQSCVIPEKRILKQNIREVFNSFHKLARVKVVLIRHPGDSGRERMALFAQQVCTHVLGTCCTCCMPQRPPFCQPGSLPISISREPNNAAKSGPGFTWCDISLSTTHKTHTLWEPEQFQRQLCVGRGSSLELSQHLPETHLAALQVENTLWGLPSGAAGFSDFRL